MTKLSAENFVMMCEYLKDENTLFDFMDTRKAQHFLTNNELILIIREMEYITSEKAKQNKPVKDMYVELMSHLLDSNLTDLESENELGVIVDFVNNYGHLTDSYSELVKQVEGLEHKELF